jgi:hypothetical protein
MNNKKYFRKLYYYSYPQNLRMVSRMKNVTKGLHWYHSEYNGIYSYVNVCWGFGGDKILF